MRKLALISMTGLLALATIVVGGEEKAKPAPVVAVPDEDAQQALLSDSRECVFNWATRDGWPMGVIM